MKGSERYVHFFELNIDTNKAKAAPPSLIEVVYTINKAIGTPGAKLQINNNTATVELISIDVEQTKNLVTFFMRNSDTAASDVHFVDPEKNTSRAARKNLGEGRGFSAHFSVSLTPENGKPNIYLAALERVNGLSSTIVARLFQSILRVMYQSDPNLFVCNDISGAKTRDGKPKEIGFRPMIELCGLPSDQFIADLQAGTLKDIQLIEQKERTQFDERPWLVEKQKIIQLGIGRGMPAASELWGELLGLFKSQSAAGFKKARIRFTRSNGKTDTVEIDSETGSLLDQRYVKASKITGIDPPLDEYSDSIVDHFATMVENELIANRH